MSLIGILLPILESKPSIITFLNKNNRPCSPQHLYQFVYKLNNPSLLAAADRLIKVKGILKSAKGGRISLVNKQKLKKLCEEYDKNNNPTTSTTTSTTTTTTTATTTATSSTSSTTTSSNPHPNPNQPPTHLSPRTFPNLHPSLLPVFTSPSFSAKLLPPNFISHTPYSSGFPPVPSSTFPTSIPLPPLLHSHQASFVRSFPCSIDLHTPTASGKSACAYYAAHKTAELGLNTLMLYPTKALGRAQRDAMPPHPPTFPDVMNGDTPHHGRPKILKSSNCLFTNIDFLHHYLLPSTSALPRSWLANLGCVVIDEYHYWSGTDLPGLISRLRCRSPSLHVVKMSATPPPPPPTPPPATFPPPGPPPPTTISKSGAPSGDKTLWITKPLPLSSLYSSLSSLLRPCVAPPSQRLKCLVFCRSRNVVETLYAHLLAEMPKTVKVITYRGGYSADKRSRLEAEFSAADIVVCTNAVQEGIDFSGFRVCVMVSSKWTGGEVEQCVGRVGRRGEGGGGGGGGAVGVIVEWKEERVYGYPFLRRGRYRGRRGEHIFEAMKELGIGEKERRVFGEEEVERATVVARERGWLRVKVRGDGEKVLAIPGSVELGTKIRNPRDVQYEVVVEEGGEVLDTVEYQRVFYYCYPGAVITVIGRR